MSMATNICHYYGSDMHAYLWHDLHISTRPSIYTRRWPQMCSITSQSTLRHP